MTDESRFKTLMASVSGFINRSRSSGSAGLSFQGERDLYKALGYDRVLTAAKFRDRYRRDGIAARIVEAMPKATWRGDPSIVEDEDPEVSTQFEEAIIELDDRLKIWSTMRRADILTGLGYYGLLLIGGPGEFAEPLEKMSMDDFLYITPWSEEDATITQFETDITSSRFGQANMYNFLRTSESSTGGISASSVGKNPTTVPQSVHWTRVIHIVDGMLDEQVFGQPRLEKVWNKLDDLDKCTGGGAEAFWLRVHPGYQLNVDKDTEMDETDMADLDEEVKEFVHNMRRYVRTRGVDMNVLSAGTANFGPQADAILTQIAGATEIPKRILVGSEAAHLASTQDRTNWHERIEDRREQFAEPVMIRPFIDRLQMLGTIPMTDDYMVQWPLMQDLDAEEKANVADKLAGLNSKIGGTIILDREIRDQILRLPRLEDVMTEEELEEMNEPEPQPEVPEVPGEEMEEGSETEEDAETNADVSEDPTDEEIQAIAEENGISEDQARAVAEKLRASRKFKSVDKQPDSEPWRDVHKAADAKRPLFAKAFADAVRAAKSQTTVKEISSALKAKDLKAIDDITTRMMTEFRKKIAVAFPELLLETLNTGGRIATSVAKTQDTLRVSQVTLSFNINNPQAIKWATEHSATLVTGVTDTSRLAIQEAIALGIEEQLTVAQSAAAIKNVVGLTPQAAKSVMARASILSRTELAKFADKQLRNRASNIARTETIAAANRGQQEFWRQAQEGGFLNPENAFQVWIVTPDDRLCPICEPMEGQVVGLGSNFETGDGDLVDSPPAHPSCRCAVGLSLSTNELVN